MNQKSSDKETSTSAKEEHRIHGADVVISRTTDQEILLIDGRPEKFQKTEAGYVLNANAFVEPQKTLLDAVKLYLKRDAK